MQRYTKICKKYAEVAYSLVLRFARDQWGLIALLTSNLMLNA